MCGLFHYSNAVIERRASTLINLCIEIKKTTDGPIKPTRTGSVIIKSKSVKIINMKNEFGKNKKDRYDLS